MRGRWRNLALLGYIFVNGLVAQQTSVDGRGIGTQDILGNLTANNFAAAGPGPWFDITHPNFGAIGNGATDATTAAINDAAIAKAITAAQNAGASGGGGVFAPPGDFAISATIGLPRGVRFVGSGRGSTRLLQTTNGIPVVQGAGSTCHSVVLRDVSLSYVTSQSNSAAVAIFFPNSGANVGPYYWWTIQGVFIHNAYDGIGAAASATFFSSNVGTEAPVIIDESFHSAINIQASSGSPGIMWGNIYVTNLVVTPSAQAVRYSGGETYFNYLSISGWVESILNFNTGADTASVGQLHIESCTVNGAAVNLIDCLGGLVSFDRVSLTVTYSGTSSGTQTLFRVINASVQCRIGQVVASITNNGAGTVRRFNTNNAGTTTLVVGQWRESGTGTPTDTGGGTSTIYQSLVSYLGSNARRIFALTDGGTVSPNPLKGDYLTLTAAGSRTIAAPSYTWLGSVIVFEITNGTGGAITTTWNAIYHLAGAWVDPATTKVRKIQFTYNGTEWVEDWRSAADITP